ncbi:MAG: metallophosphoesterase [Opitutaceae bacterium]|nr:metallophosphoesterase [Opitutaceae bacterium]
MKIAVLSDTHNSIPSFLLKELQCSDEIWHLGDVCSPKTIRPLEALDIPLKIIEGNCDSPFLWKKHLLITHAGIRFFLVHIPPRKPPKDVDVILHGHTHEPCDKMQSGIRWLNPGSISQPRGGSPASFGWLNIQKNKTFSWSLSTFS